MAVPVLDVEDTYTIETAIRAAAHQFEKSGLCYGHGTESAIDEASWLILFAMGLPPANAPDYQLQLNAEQIDSCNTLLRRRIDERMPAAYLTGQAWFAGHRFVCDSRALVPRSPLAELINSDFFGVLDAVERPFILDLCTGGGCIAIACAHALPQAMIHASDVSPEALALAQENIILHDVQDRVALLSGSLFEPVTARYDLILSNPPYVDAQDIAVMPEEFAHEPMLGLAAGGDGLDLVRLMLRDASDFLNPGGVLIVEVGNSWQALENAYPRLDFAWLEFAHGGHGVFMLTFDELLQQSSFT